MDSIRSGQAHADRSQADRVRAGPARPGRTRAAGQAAPEPALLIQARGPVAVLTLNRPGRLNAIGRDVLGLLAGAVAAAAADERVRALVITGAGRAFSAGADLDEIEALPDARAFREFIARMTEVYQMIADGPKPSVAALHGVAYGGGLELALACDLRVAEPGARLGVPEVKLGVLPGAGGTQRLPRLAPAGLAKQMILTGEPITAERAHAVGLVNELAGPGQALTAALDLATRLAAGAPLALAAGKRLVDQGLGLDLAAAIGYERESVCTLFGTGDRAEGLAAFRERRPPTFTGR
jgi:enoyl-CoA hydratase